MEPESSLDDLRRLAAAQGVAPSDDDLEAVRGFLDAILPELARLERLLEPEDEP
ncbi:MAG TPA: hypothetical protein VFB42_02385 [Gaiellaceae bacterium]|nr:hypothetical protein [Gaiellaceae bacterium]